MVDGSLMVMLQWGPIVKSCNIILVMKSILDLIMTVSADGMWLGFPKQSNLVSDNDVHSLSQSTRLSTWPRPGVSPQTSSQRHRQSTCLKMLLTLSLEALWHLPHTCSPLTSAHLLAGRTSGEKECAALWQQPCFQSCSQEQHFWAQQVSNTLENKHLNIPLWIRNSTFRKIVTWNRFNRSWTSGVKT